MKKLLCKLFGHKNYIYFEDIGKGWNTIYFVCSRCDQEIHFVSQENNYETKICNL